MWVVFPCRLSWRTVGLVSVVFPCRLSWRTVGSGAVVTMVLTTLRSRLPYRPCRTRCHRGVAVRLAGRRRSGSTPEGRTMGGRRGAGISPSRGGFVLCARGGVWQIFVRSKGVLVSFVSLVIFSWPNFMN